MGPESKTLTAILAAAALAGCRAGHPPDAAQDGPGEAPAETTNRVVLAARDQLGWGTVYDPAYVRIGYPNGDVPRKRGVCTDLAVRAFRGAGIDLQKLVREDMRANWAAYPRYPGVQAPDTNIDHRRCPNLMRFFERKGRSITLSLSEEALPDWLPGDVVFWKLNNGRDHVGIVSDRKNPRGLPLAIHNISTPAEEDVLTKWKIVGHFRYPG